MSVNICIKALLFHSSCLLVWQLSGAVGGITYLPLNHFCILLTITALISCIGFSKRKKDLACSIDSVCYYTGWQDARPGCADMSLQVVGDIERQKNVIACLYLSKFIHACLRMYGCTCPAAVVCKHWMRACVCTAAVH